MFGQVLFSGLALGSIYGLVALGFAVIFKATDVFNFAQGMFVVCGAYLAVTAISLLGLPFGLAVVFIIVGAALLGAGIHALLIQPLSGRPMLSVIMLTIALAIALRALIEITYGPQGRTLTTPMPVGALVLGGVVLSYLHLTAALVSWVGMAFFGAFLRSPPGGPLHRTTVHLPQHVPRPRGGRTAGAGPRHPGCPRRGPRTGRAGRGVRGCPLGGRGPPAAGAA